MERAILRKIDQSIADGNTAQRDLARKFYRRFLKFTARGMADITSAEEVFSPSEELQSDVPPLLYIPEQSRVIIGDEIVEFTALTNRLFGYFHNNPNRIISREELIANAWAKKSSTAGFHVAINRLRDMIEPDPKNPVRIRSVKKQGYLYNNFAIPQLENNPSEEV